MNSSENAMGKSKPSTLRRLVPYLARHWLLLVIGTAAVLVTVGISFSMGIAIQLIIDKFPKDSAEATLFLNKVLIYSLIAVVSLAVFGFLGAYILRKLATKVVQ